MHACKHTPDSSASLWMPPLWVCLLTPSSFLKPNISQLNFTFPKLFQSSLNREESPHPDIAAVLCDSLTARITACSLSLWFMFSDPPKWLCAPQRQTLWLVPPAINFHCLVWSRCLINVSCIWFSVHEKMWKITEDSLWHKHTRLLQSPGQDGSQPNVNDAQGQPSRYLRHLQTIVPNCLVRAEWN